MFLVTRAFLLAIVVLALLSPAAVAEDKRGFIRDAEVEDSIRAFSAPLFQAAGLDPEAVSVHIIIDPTLNAFVAGGQHMFIHTGLLTKMENANQLIGVMAHETGHIAGGHVVRFPGEMSNASTEALIATLLGAAVGAATGRGDAAAAISLGGQSMAMRNLLAYSRAQESAADQAGMLFLDDTHQSAKGLLEFMNVLSGQELLVTTNQDAYVRTHPLTQDRIAFIRNWVEHSPWSNEPVRPEFVEKFRRARAKLFAFLEPPVRTFQRYKETDKSVEARYARAIAAYRKPDLGVALPLLDGLIAERPDDPYFHEMKGQVLFENARGAEAIEPYRTAVKLLPNNALLHIELGQVELEQDDPAMIDAAIADLSLGVSREPENAVGWKFLGTAFGKRGNEGMASYAMAEEAVLEGRPGDAQYLAGKAERMLKDDGPVWMRLQDIKQQAGDALRRARNKEKNK